MLPKYCPSLWIFLGRYISKLQSPLFLSLFSCFLGVGCLVGFLSLFSLICLSSAMHTLNRVNTCVQIMFSLQPMVPYLQSAGQRRSNIEKTCCISPWKKSGTPLFAHLWPCCVCLLRTIMPKAGPSQPRGRPAPLNPDYSDIASQVSVMCLLPTRISPRNCVPACLHVVIKPPYALAIRLDVWMCVGRGWGGDGGSPWKLGCRLTL